MNIIYKLCTSISELLLSDFLFEIEFYSNKSKSLDEYNKKHNTKYKGDFKCYLPIIIKAIEISEAESVAIAIRRELETEYKITPISFYISDKIITKEKLSQIQLKIENKFKGHGEKLGFIDINTFIPKETDSDDLTFTQRVDRKYFKVVKSGPLPFNSQNFEYIVKYYKSIPEE